MTNITDSLRHLYAPVKALLFYKSNEQGSDKYYVESYDINRKGLPINAKPLSINEAALLCNMLDASEELSKTYLKPKGLMPQSILHIDPSKYGSVIWFSPAMERQLFFKKTLSIKNGKANLPPMVWKADRSSLSVYAIKGDQRPGENTPLCHAPFFNIYDDGRVCMGDVDIQITPYTQLESFITQWEDYFTKSYFSHLLINESPVNGNIVQLWQEQVNTKRPFPESLLIETGETIKNLIV